jgi:hypothetical protein
MSDQEMADHIKDILLTKASLGMGEGVRRRRRRAGEGEGVRRKKRRSRRMAGEGELEDILQIYGRGVYVGGKKKSGSKSRKGKTTGGKMNPWIKHVKKYAKDHGLTYAEALKSPRARSSYKGGEGGARRRRYHSVY